MPGSSDGDGEGDDPQRRWFSVPLDQRADYPAILRYLRKNKKISGGKNKRRGRRLVASRERQEEIPPASIQSATSGCAAVVSRLHHPICMPTSPTSKAENSTTSKANQTSPLERRFDFARLLSAGKASQPVPNRPPPASADGDGESRPGSAASADRQANGGEGAVKLPPISPAGSSPRKKFSESESPRQHAKQTQLSSYHRFLKYSVTG